MSTTSQTNEKKIENSKKRWYDEAIIVDCTPPFLVHFHTDDGLDTGKFSEVSSISRGKKDA